MSTRTDTRSMLKAIILVMQSFHGTDGVNKSSAKITIWMDFCGFGANAMVLRRTRGLKTAKYQDNA